jgi:hypothetical protein
MDQLLLPRRCQYNGCTHRIHANSSGRFCFTHGGRCVCSHASCLNFAQAGGWCIKHGYKKPTCSMDGCSNQSFARGLCIRHGAHHCCNVINCTNHVFRYNMCRFHYSLTNESSTVMNESITVSTTTNHNRVRHNDYQFIHSDYPVERFHGD